MSTSWFYTRDDNRFGPVSSRQLKELAASGELLPSDMLWTDGMAESIPASRLGLIAERGGGGVVPPPLPIVGGGLAAATLSLPAKPTSSEAGSDAPTDNSASDFPQFATALPRAAHLHKRRRRFSSPLFAAGAAILLAGGLAYLNWPQATTEHSTVEATPDSPGIDPGDNSPPRSTEPAIASSASPSSTALPDRTATVSPQTPENPSTLHPATAATQRDILSAVDPSKFTVSGRWRREGGDLIGYDWPRMAVPTHLTGSYEMQVEFTRHDGKDAVCVVFPVSEHRCQLFLDLFGEAGGLSTADNVDPRFNSTRTPPKLVNGKRHVLGIRVSCDQRGIAHIAVTLDRQHYLEWHGQPDQLRVSHFWNWPPDVSVAFGASTPVTFHTFLISTK